MKNSIIRINKMKFRYFKKSIFEDVNLEIMKNEIVLLTGESGSGKTTFCRLISGLEKNYSGEIFISKKENNSYTAKERFMEISYLKQEVSGNILGSTPEEDLQISQNRFNEEKDTSFKDKREDALKIYKIESLKNQPVWELSGGQKKRVGLADLYLNFNKFWLLDEPTAGLDNGIINIFMEILKQRKKQNLGALIISHRQEIFADIIHRKLEIKQNKIWDVQ